MNKNKSSNDFSVVLEKVGNQPLKTIRILMEATGLGLSDAKKLVDSAPAIVSSGLESKKALKLKAQLEAIGNIASVPGMETEITHEKPETIPKAKPTAKTKKAAANPKKNINSELAKALAKVFEIVGRDGFVNGERVYNLIGDIAPKLEKERRRIKQAYASNAVAVLMAESEADFAIKEAVKRIVDYSDMDEKIAKETIITLYNVLN